MRFLTMCRSCRVLAVLIVFLTDMAPVPAAQNEVWTDNPWGRVTIFGSGPLGTRLFAEALGQTTEIKSLFYLDTMSLPAEVESFAESGLSTITARASLAIEASNDSGLLLEGGAALIPEGAGATGFASIHVFLLIELLDPATIQIYDLRSVVAGTEGPGFSMTLFPSDALGTVTGGSLMEFSGASASGWDGAYASDTPGFFLLEVTAATQGIGPETAGFDLRFDITGYAPVPEPSTGALIIAGGLLGWLAKQRARRSLRI